MKHAVLHEELAAGEEEQADMVGGDVAILDREIDLALGILFNVNGAIKADDLALIDCKRGEVLLHEERGQHGERERERSY